MKLQSPFRFSAVLELKLCLTLLCGAAALPGKALSADAVRLLPGVPIYVSDSEPEPVRRAVKDLQRDLKKVLGTDSPVVNRLDGSSSGVRIIIAGTAPGFDQFRDPAVSGREAHAVFTRGQSVVLQGADVRGTIYAIYTFSERFLGIPPLWFWASWTPLKQESVAVPAGTALRFPSPYVRWRAWFPNDQDLLTPWRTRSDENYEAFLETMLRLKLNTLEGGMMDSRSFDQPHTAGREFRLARDRGLAVTGHHMLIFGSSYSHWDTYWQEIRKQAPPKLTIANVAALEDFWRYHIETGLKEKFEMIWLIGFRGNRDIPFWQTFPDSPATDTERGKVIQDMMSRQVALLKKVTGNPAPVMRVTLYNENSDFFAQGLLRPPDEPNLIWAFVAARRDHFPAADVRGYRNATSRPIGYYMNFQFTSSGAHLAQAEGLWKMEKNYRMVNAISGRPLEFSVVNAGNVREFVLELSANARMMWDFEGHSADAFLEDFCVQYFGREHAMAVAKLYRDFFQSYWTQKKPDLPGFERQYLFQDQRYARALEQLLAQFPKGRELNPLNENKMDKSGGYFRIVPADNGAQDQIGAIVKGTSASISKLSAVVAAADSLLPRLPADSRVFFTDNLVVQARFMLHVNETLRAVATALESLPDQRKAADLLKAAEKSISSAQDALQVAEHGTFAGWYGGDRLFGVAKLKQRIQTTINELEKGKR